MKKKEFLQDYLAVSRKERTAAIVLLLLIIACFLLPEMIPHSQGSPQPADTAWMAAVSELEAKEQPANKERYAGNTPRYNQQQWHPQSSRHSAELFYFDPNNLSADGWKKLGLRDKTIGIIQNYIAKGGHFRVPVDLKRVYGLFPDEYERIEPYIRIEPTGADNHAAVSRYPSTSSYPVRPSSPRYSMVDINVADTTALIALPGIGSKLATRIVNFRDKLGGFYSIEQVAETFGLSDSTFQKIKPYLKLERVNMRLININTATIEELKLHPYLKYHIASSIMAYRKEHGEYASVSDIKKVMAVSDDIFRKIQPYLTTEKR